MSPASALLDSYQERDHILVLGLTAAIAFLDGLALVYRYHLRELNYQQMGLSFPNEIAYILGPMLFDPILLFGILYFTAVTMDPDIPLPTLVPGLAAAVLVGSVTGQLVGMDAWPAFTPLVFLERSNLLHPHPQTFLYWQDILSPLVRALLTAIAAIGLAQARD